MERIRPSVVAFNLWTVSPLKRHYYEFVAKYQDSGSERTPQCAVESCEAGRIPGVSGMSENISDFGFSAGCGAQHLSNVLVENALCTPY